MTVCHFLFFKVCLHDFIRLLVSILVYAELYELLAPREIAGFELPPENPFTADWGTLLRQPLPSKLPVGKHGYQESLSDYLDATVVLPELELAFRVWMSNVVSGGGEDGTHYRNDGLLHILELLGGLTFFDRNNVQSTTKEGLRQDVTLGFQSVPLVHVEEKRDKVSDGVVDLRNKLHWIPNLNKVPCILGFAISVTHLQIWRLTSQGITDKNPIFATCLVSVLDRMNAVVAVVHCARVLKFYTQSDVILLGSSLRFNQWHFRADGIKSIKLGYNVVQIRYSDPQIFSKMVAFYQANAEVSFMERMIKHDEKTLHLQPLGVSQVPETAAELVIALRCVLTCLRNLHANGYFHADLRWSNIVCVRDGQWYVIDCTNFVRADDPEEIRTMTSSRCHGEFRFDMSPWSAKHELFQIGRLAEHVIEKFRLSNAAFSAWTMGCLQGTYGSAEEVLGALPATIDASGEI